MPEICIILHTGTPNLLSANPQDLQSVAWGEVLVYHGSSLCAEEVRESCRALDICEGSCLAYCCIYFASNLAEQVTLIS